MIKKYRLETVYLTQYILEQYWQGNLMPLVSHMHNDILWIGSMDEEYVHGKEDMIKRVKENNNEMPLVYLDNQEYEVVQNEGNTCIVVGRYRAYTKPDSGLLLSEKQRITFVWNKVSIDGEEKLLIKHIHLMFFISSRRRKDFLRVQAVKTMNICRGLWLREVQTK